jgi:glutathione peroxidase
MSKLTSIYDLEFTDNRGNLVSLADYSGKPILIVNTASKCGFTPQYEGLQKLNEEFREQGLIVLGFPCDQFAHQEPGNDQEIDEFCKVNFGVSFPLVKKSTVIKAPTQHPVYQWLTQENKNGWNEFVPNWNFCKYLIDEKGDLTHVFESGIEPMGKEMQAALEEA